LKRIFKNFEFFECRIVLIRIVSYRTRELQCNKTMFLNKCNSKHIIVNRSPEQWSPCQDVLPSVSTY